VIDTVQVIYNVFDPTAAAELFVRAQAAGVGVLARSPLDEGGLTGAVTTASTFHPEEFRARYFGGDRPAALEARVDGLRRLLGDEARSLAELAMRFALSHPAVSSVLAGMRRTEHVQQNLAWADGRTLSPALLDQLADHAWPRNWYL